MPKLEMNALTLAARLALSISQALKTSISERPWNVYVFSDSQIALSWLSSSKRRNLGVLVTNRILEIRRIVQKLNEDGTNVTFAYVNTSENPADAGTRGLSKEELDRHIWWTGPSFLTQPRKYWYNTFYQLATDEDGSERGVIDDECNIGAIGSRTLPVKDLLCWERFSSLTAAKRVVAIVLRFLQKITSPLDQTVKERIATNIPELKDATGISGPLTAIEIKKARLVLIRNHQSIHLSDSYKKSMENTLRLYKDNNHLWRSRGRLGNALLKDETRSPFFITPNTSLAKLIISEAHGVYHRGIEHTISTVRESYWIPKLRQQVRKLISSCVKCRRFNALPYRYPETTDLPCQRVVRCRPFQNTGLDFFDLPPCKEHGKVIKLYGCIFTCTTTRLIHLEVVRSMATEEFINALRRFIARRGLPQTITCDNAPTFLLTKNILSESPANINTRISQEAANKEIQWNHITPYAPWQGGFYERLIKSIKHAIYKALGSGKRHSLDEINTFVAEVEATLNTRPLTYQGEAQEAMTSIRPIDFVHRNMTLTLPISENIDTRSDSDYLPPDETRSLQYRQEVIEALQSANREAQRFWDIWQQQYLVSLREVHRKHVSTRRQGTESPEIGDVVLVSDPVLSRNEWKMGRITGLRYSADGEAREAELVTSTRRTIRRPVNLLIPLEIQEAQKQSENCAPLQPHSNPQCAKSLGEQTQSAHPYNLRHRRKPESSVQIVTSGSVCNSNRFSPKWFLFHMMILLLSQVTWSIKTSSINRECNVNSYEYINKAEIQKPKVNQTSKTCESEINDAQKFSHNIHPKPSPVIISQVRMFQNMNMNHNHNELCAVEQQLKEIQLELQQLPIPDQLCDIVRQCCCEFYDCIHTTITLELTNELTNVLKLKVPENSQCKCSQMADILKLQCENLRARFTSMRSHLHVIHGIISARHEEKIIDDNAAYMEGIETDELSYDLTDDEENNNERSTEAGHSEESVREDALEEEIQSKKSAIQCLDDFIKELENQPTCPSRNCDQGAIIREEERFMRCAFCEAIGLHYSDSCSFVRLSQDRLQLLWDKGKCEKCLERYCLGGRSCRKYFSRCRYCRLQDHHSAICALPEYADETRSRLQRAKEERSQYLHQLRSLEKAQRATRHRG